MSNRSKYSWWLTVEIDTYIHVSLPHVIARFSMNNVFTSIKVRPSEQLHSIPLVLMSKSSEIHFVNEAIT